LLRKVSLVRAEINPSLQVILFAMSKAREDRYNALKKLCYVEQPITSQVCLLIE
jgi:hypothetical protein